MSETVVADMWGISHYGKTVKSQFFAELVCHSLLDSDA